MLNTDGHQAKDLQKFGRLRVIESKGYLALDVANRGDVYECI